MDSIGRRELLRCLGIAAAGVSAPWLGLVPSVGAQVQIPSEFDNGLDSIAVAFKAPSGMTLGYWSQPKAAGMRPGIVMLHDVAGLSAGVRGMARSVANSGYAVVAPDVLSVQGGTAGFRGNDAEVQSRVTEVLSGEDGTEIWSLVMLAERLDEVIQQCKVSAEPANIAKYTFTLAKAFSRFYQRYHILQEADQVRQAVLIAVAQIIRRQLIASLSILGIRVPTQM